LGTRSAFVVHGDGGLDEGSLSGRAKISEVKDGSVHTYYLDPAEYGFSRADVSDLQGGDAACNAEITRNVLQGETGPKRDVVVINSALALVAAGKADNVGEGILLAQNVINQGLAHDKLNELIKFSNELAGGTARVV
ncbi:anthranilate phosphoribosyltransferase, partial [bacterium]